MTTTLDLVALRAVIDQLDGQIPHHHHETLVVLHARLAAAFEAAALPAGELSDRELMLLALGALDAASLDFPGARRVADILRARLYPEQEPAGG